MTVTCSYDTCGAPASVVYVTPDGGQGERETPRCPDHDEPDELLEPVLEAREVAP